MKKTRKTKTAALSREFENFLADIESLLQATSDLTGAELHEAKKKVLDRVTEAKALVVELSDGLAKRARKSGASMNKEIHEEPWKAVAAGAGIGLLFGMLFTRQ